MLTFLSVVVIVVVTGLAVAVETTRTVRSIVTSRIVFVVVLHVTAVGTTSKL